jgi:hypothetical protein
VDDLLDLLAQLCGEFAAGSFHDRNGQERAVADLCDPSVAGGECANVSWQFALFCRAQGLQTHVRDSDPDSLGYHDRPLAGVSRHTVCGFRAGRSRRDLPLAVDWTCAQYGYEALPLLLLREGGRWQRVPNGLSA